MEVSLPQVTENLNPVARKSVSRYSTNILRLSTMQMYCMDFSGSRNNFSSLGWSIRYRLWTTSVTRLISSQPQTDISLITPSLKLDLSSSRKVCTLIRGSTVSLPPSRTETAWLMLASTPATRWWSAIQVWPGLERSATQQPYIPKPSRILDSSKAVGCTGCHRNLIATAEASTTPCSCFFPTNSVHRCGAFALLENLQACRSLRY